MSSHNRNGGHAHAPTGDESAGTATAAEAAGAPLDLFDERVNNCPYATYERLRDEHPVWRDPSTGMYVISRYEDVRSVLLDSEHFSSEVGSASTRRELTLSPDADGSSQAEVAARAERVRRIYETEGWVTAPNLDALDEPAHRQRRRAFEHAFGPQAIDALSPAIEAIATQQIEGALGQRPCEWVAAFAVPLPLRVIGHMVGIPDEDLPTVKGWTDAYVARMSLRQDEEETLASVRAEIQMQHYFQERIERLRLEPDDSLLSLLVNTELPELQRTMTDEELHGELLSDIVVGGAETTTNALSAGARYLAEHPTTWNTLRADRSLLPTFVEEILRLESPVQSLLRRARTDLVLHGITIPAGAVINPRYGAANRDERAFAQPATLDLSRSRPRRHLAFGLGPHHCLGAGLARAELVIGFSALLDRVERVSLTPGRNDFAHRPNYFLRSLCSLQLDLVPVDSGGGGTSDGRAVTVPSTRG